jgi:hypothetical protein
MLKKDYKIETVISTKLKTTNIGNQALSDELISLAKNKNHYVVGRPFGLDKYSTKDINSTGIEGFESIAKTISKINITRKPDDTIFSKKTNLLDFKGNTVKTEPLRVIFRKLRKLFFSFFTVSPAYRKRLGLYNSTKNYLYSAAGEVSEEEFFFRQLLDLRIAQLKGVNTYAINQSTELKDGIYKDLLMHVYKHMKGITLRGKISKEFLIKGGVPEQIISLAPDTAFLTEVNLLELKKEIKKIGINFTKKTYDPKVIDVFLKDLLDQGYELEFITNDPYGDENIALVLESKFGIKPNLMSVDYHDYVKILQKFDLIISSRLHTNELAFTGGIPVVPIEGNLHKTKEVFELIDYPIPVVEYNSEDYASALKNSFEKLKKEFTSTQEWIREKLPLIRIEAKKNITLNAE